MTDLTQFDVQKKTQSHREDLFFSLKDMFGLGVKEFSKTLSNMFSVNVGGKHQISSELSRWEKSIKKIRKK